METIMPDENNRPWVPEIMYEEGDGGLSSHIPFIQVPSEEDMPRMLFIFESIKIKSSITM